MNRILVIITRVLQSMIHNFVDNSRILENSNKKAPKLKRNKTYPGSKILEEIVPIKEF
jgi:hypothetical protein